MSKVIIKEKLVDVWRDLIVLAADKDTEQALVGLFNTRAKSLQIRPIIFDTVTHEQHDPGCLLQSGGILAPYLRSHQRALIVFDREGCGRETLSRVELEHTVERGLADVWADRVAVIVNDPELESWVWNKSPHLPELLGWPSTAPPLPNWLVEEGYL